MIRKMRDFKGELTWFFEIGNLDRLTIPGVCNLLTGLFTIFEIARAHLVAVFAEPLPISFGHTVYNSAFSLDGAVFVILDVSATAHYLYSADL